MDPRRCVNLLSRPFPTRGVAVPRRHDITLPDLSGKDPATIAVSVAADLVRTFERERATSHTEATR